MMHHKIVTALFLSVFSIIPLTAQHLTWKKNSQGYELIEDGNSRLFYQMATIDKEGKYPRANYIHPLYNIDGDIITEDFPEDHLHHRGIFWTWHQLYVDGKRVADPWISENISWKIIEATPSVIEEDWARLTASVVWIVDEKEVVEELLVIDYERVDPELYKLSFDITLKPLADRVQIGGSEDAKGYGGFSPRIKLDEKTRFFDENGQLIPQELPLGGGSWINITQEAPDGPGVAILGEPHKLPSYQGWILRQKNSMQNMAFPGKNPIDLPREAPFLRFRNQLLVHKGLQTAEINLFYENFTNSELSPRQVVRE